MRAPAAHTPWPARGVPEVLLGEVVWVGRAMGKTRGGPRILRPPSSTSASRYWPRQVQQADRAQRARREITKRTQFGSRGPHRALHADRATIGRVAGFPKADGSGPDEAVRVSPPSGPTRHLILVTCLQVLAQHVAAETAQPTRRAPGA